MNTSSSNHFLLIGLPGSGKTSFLAALWYMVNRSGEECELQLEKLEGVSKYLNEIRDAWLQYKPVPRNQALSEKFVSMRLKSRKTNAGIQVTFPDISGESYRFQWTARQMTTQYDARLREAGGGLLFVHSDNIAKPLRIDMAEPLIEAIAVETSTGENSGGEAPPQMPKEWDPETSPTQVQLVELLQFMISRDHFQPRFRLAIVVSAWDLVTLTGKLPSPDDWIAEQLPLLRQFLEANHELFDVSFYGISAQGGRYASSLFTSGDFKDVDKFVVRLTEKKDALSAWLWEQMDSQAQLALQETGQSPETLQSVLVRSLNGVLANASIFDEARFGGVKLRKETKEHLDEIVAKRKEIGEETLRVNRLLLEDAYSSFISTTRQFAKEAAKLQEKEPDRRVLLVGKNVKNPHDITEPLQWLMQ
jgi:hypothetical protein